MESFEAIYSDIGLFNQALVGSMVFYKQYVFSQQGVAKLTMLNYFVKGDAITYTDIIRLAEDNALLDLEKAFTMYFEPNFKLNAETGEVSLNKLSINVVNEDGSQGTSEIPFSSFAEDI
jgi:hypothetical protein